MSMWERFKVWALTQNPQSIDCVGPAVKPVIISASINMVGEPVTSFIASLKREPKRYKLKRVIKLPSHEFPQFSCYHWMHGAGYYTLLDRKTGVKYAGYVHESNSLYSVYGLPFQLNHWELVALFEAFNVFRVEARNRRLAIREWAYLREREKKELQEKQDRIRFAEQFK